MFFVKFRDPYTNDIDHVEFAGPFTTEHEANEFVERMNDLHPDFDAELTAPCTPVERFEELKDQFGDDEDGDGIFDDDEDE